ncbi:MAG: SHOCT domain-containing protein [Acidimicrobiia bacterium]|jgi:putative membrane protein
MGVLAAILQGIGSSSDDHMSGGWWWVMGIGWLAFLGAIAAIVYAATRNHRPPTDGRRSADDILDELFARGEIDADEYRQRRDVLRR